MDGRLLDEYLALTALGGLVLCLGIVFVVIQERTKATIGLGATWIATGLAVSTFSLLADSVDPNRISPFERLQIVFEVGLTLGLCTYISGILATTQASPRGTAVVRLIIRVGYVEAGLLAVLGFVLPAERANDYLQSLGEPGVFSRPGFWVFATYYTVAMVTFASAWVVLARERLDEGEHARALYFALSSPFLVSTTVLPYRAAVLSFTITLVLLLIGLFSFAVAQGERGVFLSRFLSPQVSELVRLEGLTAVMKPHEVELTVVCCDLRGFTAYAEAVPSQTVIDLLGEYYDVIGDAVAEVDGTIKDYAGDGILVLVGAPLARLDHAAAGLVLASRIIDVGHEVTEHWGTRPHPLGLGVGVATGRVTVGAIGSTGRTEYTAVGAAVNLAARLCSAAGDGEILVDERTAALAGMDVLEPRGAMAVKGLSAEVGVFAVRA